MTITEKVANLKGYLEALELDESKKENKIIAKIVDILDDLALTVEDLEEETASLRDYCDELDEDLGDLEEYVFECDDDDDDYEDDDYFEVTCPKCGATIYLDESDDLDDVCCPECGEEIDFTCDGCCEECGKDDDKD